MPHFFRSGGEAGWLKSKIDFIVKDLGARKVISISEKVSQIYANEFNNSLEIINNNKQTPIKDLKLWAKNFGYSNIYMASDWTAMYSNYLISEIAFRNDKPNYVVVDEEEPDNIKYSKKAYTTNSQFNFFKDTVVVDIFGNIAPIYQLNVLDKEQPTYFAKENGGVFASGYYLVFDNEIAKEHKDKSNLVFANITKPLTVDAVIDIQTFDKIVELAQKNVKTLNQNTINKYRNEIISNNNTNFRQIVDLVSLSLIGFQDLYKFKKAIREISGYDGVIILDKDIQQIKYAIAWFHEQIKSVNNQCLDKLEKDTVLFSKSYDENGEEDYNEYDNTNDEYDSFEEKFNYKINGMVNNNYFELVSNPLLNMGGYAFKVAGFPFYINGRILETPLGFEKNDLFYNAHKNEITVEFNDIESDRPLFCYISQDYIHPKTGVIYPSARFFGFWNNTSCFGTNIKRKWQYFTKRSVRRFVIIYL